MYFKEKAYICIFNNRYTTIKAILTLLTTLLCCLGLNAQTATEYFNVGNPIEFCGTQFSLVWSDHWQNDYFIQEYLPEGETLEHYNQMFTVNVIFWDTTPMEAVQAKIAELDQRKTIDPVTNYMSAEKNGDYILEFIVSDYSNGNMDTVEVDLHHYKQMTINGRKAIVLFFYSCRAYGDDIMPFIRSIPEKRNAWYDGMSNLNLIPKFPKE